MLTIGCVSSRKQQNREVEVSLIGDYEKVAILPYGSEEQKQFFLRLAKEINKGEIEVPVQSYLETNKLLKDAGIEDGGFDASKISSVLGADAIIICKSSILESQGGRDVSATVSVSIYDTRTLKLVWEKETEVKSKFNLAEMHHSLVGRGIKELVDSLPWQL